MFQLNLILLEFFNQSDDRVNRVTRSVAVHSDSIGNLIKSIT